jgi:glyoxylase-like metal-dependent hydrolase (beta-lactamase superfamily II)
MPVGQLEANCYVVTDEDSLQCAVIDPGDEVNTIMDYIEDNKLKVEAILLTHGHFDHTGAAASVAEETGADIWINKADAMGATAEDSYKYLAPDGTKFYSDGDVIEVGSLKFHVMETPGHSPGSVTLRCEDALFTGDTLFSGSCGRTDLPGGDMDTLMRSLKRLGDMPGNYEVWPGHMDPTTLDIEKANNYYMRYAKGL